MPGATWWRIDVHGHSPSSFDYGADEGSVSASSVTYDQWLLAYMRAEVDAVVISDHNTHEGIDEAREALARLQAVQGPDYRDLVILPGVEITTPDGYHLLAIFEEGTSSEVVNGLLHKGDYSGERGTSSRTTTKSFQEMVALIDAAGGLAVPAHADGNAGLFGMDVRNIDSLSETSLVRAVEIVGSDLSNARKRSWLPLLGSDAHHLDAVGAPIPSEAKFPGSHFTWLKAGRPNLAGLRLAISDGEDSIQRSIDVNSDPGEVSHSQIESVRISHKGDVEEFTLSAWLNSVIGGRGTGKSTLIELARLVFGRFDELPHRLKADLAWFSPQRVGGNEGRFWDSETSIEVIYKRDNERFRLRWSGHTPSETEIARLGGETPEVQSGDVSERFPVFVVSQKQLFEMASNAQSLLAVIDQQPDVDFADWKQRHDALVLQYRTQRAEIEEIRNRVADENRVRGNLVDAESLVARLAQLRNSAEARELDELRNEDSAETQLEDAAIELEANLSNAVRDFKDVSSQIGELRSEWLPERIRHAAIYEALGLAEAASSVLATSKAELDKASGSVNPRGLRIEELSEGFKEIDVPAARAGSAEPDPYSSAFLRRDSLQRDLARIERERDRLQEYVASAETTLQRVRESRASLTQNRNGVLAGLNSEDFKLRLVSQGDRSGLEEDLRAITQRSASFDVLFGSEGFPSLLKTHPFNPKSVAEIGELRSFLKALREGGKEAAALFGYTGATIDSRFIQHLENIDSVQFEADVDLWAPEDYLQVTYRQEGESQLKPIDEGSPGQKTAALLAIVLQLGTQPLLLDQPEDDLDNLLIYDLVVRTLRRVKRNRQVIVVTHNANIVVNSDSENVIVLKHGGVPTVVSAGSIQEIDVRNAVCRIMEGGEAAFSARYNRLLRGWAS